MKIDATRAKLIAAALAAARTAEWDEDSARGSALTTVMKGDPTLEALFDRRSSTNGPPQRRPKR